MATFTQTSTFNAPTLAYNGVQGLKYPGLTLGTMPNPVTIPLVLDQYSGVTARSNVNVVTTMPVIQENFTYGGTVVGEGTSEFPRVTIGGYIETPSAVDGDGNLVSLLLQKGEDNFYGGISYADFIIMCLEGRVSSTWQRFDPVWFRDPYGRQFTRVRVMDFNATYVEGVAGRTNFSATLLTL